MSYARGMELGGYLQVGVKALVLTTTATTYRVVCSPQSVSSAPFTTPPLSTVPFRISAAMHVLNSSYFSCFIAKYIRHLHCEMEKLVETHTFKLCVMLRSLVLRRL